MKAWSGKSHGGFFFFSCFRGVLEVSVPSCQQRQNKGCVWFQVGPEPITLEQQELPWLQLSRDQQGKKTHSRA